MTDQPSKVVPFVSATCQGETCFCGEPAVRKVGEEIPYDEPIPHRHNLTRYVCAFHYGQMMGPLGAAHVGLSWPLAVAGNPSAPTTGTQACKAEVNNDLQPPLQGDGEADRDLSERLDAILVEEDRMHPIGCATWEEEARIAIDMAKDRIAALKPQTPDVLGEADVMGAIERLTARVAEGRMIDGDTPSRVQHYVTADIETLLAAFKPQNDIVAWERLRTTGSNIGWVPVAAEDIPHYRSMGQEIRGLKVATPPGDVLGGEGEGR